MSSCPSVTVYLPQPLARFSFLHLVTQPELEDLRLALARGGLPSDLDYKLQRLAEGSLGDRQIEQGCRSMIALIQAVYAGAFPSAAKSDCERLLRVLAYVRKDDDAIADYRSEGFVDDQQELRAVRFELGSLMQRFKEWRLRHQVPALWQARA